MSAIFLITISGLRRTPKKTRAFLNQAEPLLQIRKVGIDLRNLRRETLIKDYDLSLAELVSGGELSSGEVGCLLSHQNVYTIITSENIDWAIVIEDDAEILVSAQDLISISKEWFDCGYELVHLSPYIGGVVLNEKQNKSGKALVPPLSAYAYWISARGAKKLQTKHSIIGGLADWPIQIANLRMRSVFKPMAFSGLDNSTIEPVQNFYAQTRISLSYLPIIKLISFSNLKILFKAISVYGFVVVVKYTLLFRIYKRFGRFLKFTQKGQNKTSFFRSA